MIRKDFSRSFLRMGYDASEVLSFLVDIERTITGEETDPKKVITAQKAEDQEFSVKWRGFNDEEVDMEIDRLFRCCEALIASASRRRRTPSRLRRSVRGGAASAPVAAPAQPAPTPAVAQMPQVAAGGAGVAGAALPEQTATERSAVPLAHASATLPTTNDFISAPPVVIPDAEPMALPAEYADFGTQKAVDDILRSMTQSKEQ